MKENRYNWKAELPTFREKSKAYFDGELKRLSFYSTAGRFGVATQRGDDKAMLRLRMPAGRVTKEQFLKIADWTREYDISLIHMTTGQSVQLHNLGYKAVNEIMEKALDAGIITMGMGGKYARNIICTPLTGVTADEPFDIMPYAQAANNYSLGFITSETTLPQKLKIAFSNQADDIAHATFHDLGFVAMEDGSWDVYSGGGMGLNPMTAVKVAEHVDPADTLYYLKAMWLMYTEHGNYQMHGRARVRHMQESLGGAEEFIRVFQENVTRAFADGEDLKLDMEQIQKEISRNALTKTGPAASFSDPRLTAQKQPGLYSVRWHPIGGNMTGEEWAAVADVIRDMENVEIRLSPEEEMFIINLTAEEAQRVLQVTEGGAVTRFERSVACIGSSICQFGVRDPQETLRASIEAVRKAGLPANALGRINISGCPSSCAEDGRETIGEELGNIFAVDVPRFLVAVGKEVAASGHSFEEWIAAIPAEERAAAIGKIAKEFMAD